MNETPKSKCCKANVKVHGVKEGTSYYVCTACYNACDIYNSDSVGLAPNVLNTCIKHVKTLHVQPEKSRDWVKEFTLTFTEDAHCGDRECTAEYLCFHGNADEVRAFIKKVSEHEREEGKKEMFGGGFLCGRLEEFPGKTFVGGCGEHVSFMDSYRCADCTASFHRNCLRLHFNQPHNG